MEKYTTLRLAFESNHHDADWRHPIQVLDLIRQDPSITDAVQAVEYSPPYPSEFKSQAEQEEEAGLNSELQTLLERCNFLSHYIDDLEFLTESEKVEWKDLARNLHRNVCFLVLLSLCRNATKLALVDVYDLPRHFDAVIVYLQGKYQTAVAAGDDPFGRNASKVAFPLITDLELAHWDTEGGVRLDDMACVMRIPTLKRFSGHLVSDSEEYTQWTWPAKYAFPDALSSNVEEAIFTFSAISPSALVEFVRNLPRLQSLEYEDGHDFTVGYVEDDEWNVGREYAHILRRYARPLFRERSFIIRLRESESLIIVRPAAPNEVVDDKLGLSSSSEESSEDEELESE